MKQSLYIQFSALVTVIATKIVNIEARTCIDMIRHQILPAALSYTVALSDTVISKKTIGASCKAETALVTSLSEAADALYETCEKLESDLNTIPDSIEARANYYHEVIVADMDAARTYADTLEQLTAKSYWPYPTYSDLLFY